MKKILYILNISIWVAGLFLLKKTGNSARVFSTYPIFIGIFKIIFRIKYINIYI